MKREAEKEARRQVKRSIEAEMKNEPRVTLTKTGLIVSGTRKQLLGLLGRPTTLPEAAKRPQRGVLLY